MNEEILQTTVDEVVEAITSEVKAIVIAKDNALVEKLAEIVFDVPRKFGAPMVSAKEFLEGYGTTIGGLIMLPKAKLGPLNMLYLIVHEGAHVGQFNQHGMDFVVKYLIHGEARAAYEAAAIVQEMALTMALTGQVMSDKDRPDMLVNGYMLAHNDVRLAKMLAHQQASMIRSGYVQPVDGKISTAAIAIQTIKRVQPGLLNAEGLAAFEKSGLVG